MTPADVTRAFEERLSAVHDLQALAREADGREFTAEEPEKFERQNTAIDTLDDRIQTALRAMEREAKAAEAVETFRSYNHLTTPTVESADEQRPSDEDNFRKLCSGEIRSFYSHPSERRDMTKGTDAAGGYTVDSTMYDRIIRKLEDESQVVRAGALVINTAGGEDLLVPRVTANPSASLISEASAITEVQATLAQQSLKAWKYAALTQASQELLQDSSFYIADFITDVGGAAVTRAAGVDISNGSGSSRPKGIAQAATSFGTSASATTITAANLIEVWSTMGTSYKNDRTAWLMSPEAVKVIRLLTDDNSQFLWQPGLQAETPANLLGYPVYVDGNLDAVTSGKRAVVFAFMPAFAVRVAGGLQIDRSDDFAFSSGLATFRMQARIDSNSIDDNGIGCLTQA